MSDISEKNKRIAKNTIALYFRMLFMMFIGLYTSRVMSWLATQTLKMIIISLSQKKAKENDVVLTGFIKDRKLHSLLTHASCFCLPSSHEGLPIALLEAMSYNIPVVASDIPANLEIGLDNRHYFPCGNIEKLADRIEEMVSHSDKIHYNMHRYNWDNIARQTAEVYNKVFHL